MAPGTARDCSAVSTAPAPPSPVSATGSPAEPIRAGARRAPAVAALLVAWNLRAAIVAISPLLPEIRRSTGMSSTMAGLLTTLPLVCFGLFAFVAPALHRRAGQDVLLATVLAVLAAGILVRLAPGLPALFAGTTLAGAAIAVGNVTLPVTVRQCYPGRVALVTGLVAVGVSGGAALASGLTIPIAHAFALGWRPALAVWAIPALAALAAVGWTVRPRRAPAPTPVPAPVLLPSPPAGVPGPPSGARQGTARRARQALLPAGALPLTAFMGLQSLDFYATAAWLPTVFQSHGVSASASGWLVSLASLVSIPASLGAPLLAARSRRSAWLVAAVAACGAGLVGIALDPSGPVAAYVSVLGVGQGATFALALRAIATRATSHESVARLSSVVQGGGYLVAALGPVAIGALHALSGGWTLPLAVLVALLVPEALAGILTG